MSCEVEVLEGGVSKEAVFGGQECGDQSGGLFAGLRDRIRLGDQRMLTCRVCNPYFFTGFTPQRPQHPSLNAQSISTSSQAYVKQSSTCYTDQVTNQIK